MEVVEELIQPQRIDSRAKRAVKNLYAKTRPAFGPSLLRPKPSTQQGVYGLFERDVLASGEILELGGDIVVECQRRPHGNIMMPHYFDVKMLTPVTAAFSSVSLPGSLGSKPAMISRWEYKP